MLNQLKKHAGKIIFTGVVVMCLLLLGFVIAVINRYSGTVEDKISDKATMFSLKTDVEISQTLHTFEEKAAFAAGEFSNLDENMPFQMQIYELESRFPLLKSLRYVKDGVLYDTDCTPNAYTDNYAALISDSVSGNTATYGIVFDYDYKMNMFAFYAPVENNPNLDSVILFYSENAFYVDNVEEKVEAVESADFVLLCTQSGRVVNMVYPPLGTESIIQVTKNTDILVELADTLPKDIATALSACITGDEDITKTFLYNGEQYAFSVRQNHTCSDLIVVSLYRANQLDADRDDAIASIGSVLILLCLAVPIILLAFFLLRKKSERLTKVSERVNKELKCLTVIGFEEEAEKSIKRFPGTKYAIVGARLKHYQYLSETYPANIPNILMSIRNFLNTNLEVGELLGTANAGEFVLLLHYKNVELLTKRLWSISNLITSKVSAVQYNARLDFGIYEVPQEQRQSAHAMVSNAFKTIDADPSTSGLSNVTVFSDVFKDSYMQSAEIEVKMDLALENEEFKVFFQPQLNIVTDKIEGCEALVRWYDEAKGEYRQPGTFLPLFEQNGFIYKLDRYVFYKACEFIGLRLSQNLPVFPTSINISRLTALSEGFMEYYGSIKNKFGIPDNFITLELTESLASQSYEDLNTISTAIHNTKFLVSIDDYGAGYSSFNVLKNIKTDEIKIDRMFLNKGISAENDKILLTSIVRMAKELGIKTVQEGVETADQLAYVKEAGCTVVQGYYLSKPLTMLDYIKFIDARTSEDERRARSRTFVNRDDD